MVLGSGAFGTVVKAFDEKLHRVVAIKILNLDLARSPDALRRFLREARAGAAIAHQNVVSIFAVEEHPLPYLVMEFVAGETLQHYLERQGRLTLPQVVEVGKQLCAGLAAAHSAGLVHRDVKPQNVLLVQGDSLVVKLTDFGLARACDDTSLTQHGLIAGTPMYMAPEQARGESLDHRADLFSLGSVLYQMVSGRPPFTASSTVALLKQVCDAQAKSITEEVPQTPKWLCEIIERLMEKQPDKRFQSAREVAGALRLGGQVDGSRRIDLIAEDPNATQSRPTPVADRARNRRFLLLGSFAVLLLLIGAMSIMYMLSGGPNKNRDVVGSAPENTLGEPSAIGKDNPAVDVTTQRGLTFDGVDDYVDLSQLFEFDGGDLTFEVWLVPVKESSTGADNLLVIDQGTRDNRKSLRLLRMRFRDEQGLIRENIHMSRPPDDDVFTFPVQLIPGKLTHLAAVWSGDQRRLYVDGTSIKPNSYKYDFKPWQGPAYCWMGAIAEPEAGTGALRPAGCWEGEIRQVRLSSGAVYNSQFVPPAKLIASQTTIGLYFFDDVKSGVLQDLSGHGRNATVFGLTGRGQ